jgi:hypothetical protein
LSNRIGGIIGALALAVHPLLEDTATRAWSDPLLMLLVALAAVAAYRLADRPTWPRAILLGTLLGLGGATKLSPLLLTLPLAMIGAIVLGQRWLRARRGDTQPPDRLGWHLLAVTLVAFALFVAVYPYTWTDPVDHTYTLFEFRADSFRAQAAAFPPAKVDGLTDAFRRIGDELGARFSATERIVVALDWRDHDNPSTTWPKDGYDLAVAIVGLLLLIVMVARRGLRSAHALVAAVIGGQAAIVLLGMGVEYARYLLPVLLLVVICIGVAAGQTWTAVARLIEARVSARRSTPRAVPIGTALTEGLPMTPRNE